jgi:hypothetical protein
MSAVQECMTALDVERARKIWGVAFPHLPSIDSDVHMLITLHMARTQSETIDERLRFYSHQWLSERGYPSQLPDKLRPAAERLYPIKVSSVGISVNIKSELFRPLVTHVRGAMENAVMEVYSDGKQDDVNLIRQRMFEARRFTVRKLLGIKSDG